MDNQVKQRLQNGLSNMINRVGSQMTVNNGSFLALIDATSGGDHMDMQIKTATNLIRGNYVVYNNNTYIVYTEVQYDELENIYTAKLRKCDFSIRFVGQGYDFTALGYLDMRKFDASTQSYYILPSNQVEITIGVNNFTDKLAVDYTTTFTILKKTYSPLGYDKTKSGLLVISAKTNS